MTENEDPRRGGKSERVDPVVQAHREELTSAARERHDVLTAAIGRLEAALAAPASRRARPWSERVAQELGFVREAIRGHVHDIEEPNGLFAEMQVDHPRLSARIAELKQEHASLLTAASGLAAQLPGGDDADFQALRREAATLLAALKEHRALEADLIYEAFWTDLGAGD